MRTTLLQSLLKLFTNCLTALLLTSAPLVHAESTQEGVTAPLQKLGMSTTPLPPDLQAAFNAAVIQDDTLLSNAPQPLENFGTSAAIDGDTVVVGAPFILEESGAGFAYVFTRSDSGWALQQTLQSNSPATFNAFGFSVAIAGDTIVVGEVLADVDAVSEAGRVHVFTRTGTTWSHQQALSANPLSEDSQFGRSVAISGNTIVVGAPNASFINFDGISETGAAYVFTRSGSTWTQQSLLAAETLVSNEGFGFSVAIHANTIAVGVPLREPSDGLLFAGGVETFTRNGTSWVRQQTLLSPSPTPGEVFGFAVALTETTLVVGAPFFSGTSDGSPTHGTASVFSHNGTSWVFQQTLTSPDAEGGELFGQAVAIHGDIIVIGAPEDDEQGVQDAGSAAAFVDNGTEWEFEEKLTVSAPQDQDFFGSSVAVSGNTILVGIPFAAAPGENNATGAVAVFTLTGVIEALFESPINGAVAGIALIRGWGFDSLFGHLIKQIDLFIGGEQATTIACCSQRKDIQTAFPDAPPENTLNSGWGLTFNWGNVPAGLHTVRVDLMSTSGAMLSTESRAIDVVKLGDFPFLDLFDLSQATEDINGQEIVLSNVRVRDKDSQAEKMVDARFQWRRADQGFRLIDSTTLAQLTPAPSGLESMLASLWSSFVGWLGGFPTTPNAFANPGVEHVFESPANGPVSGIALVRGWAFETEDEEDISTVELFIDGQLNTPIACCSERLDVQAAFSAFGNALNSGWGLTINWGDLSEGQHSVQVRIENTLGEPVLSEIRTVTVIKPGGFSFLDSLDLSEAIVSIDGQDVVLSGVTVTDSASETTATVTLLLRWSQASQTLEIIGTEITG